MKSPIPVIDIFAGPGGLGEGFSTPPVAGSPPAFKIVLSIEKDRIAHQTLELRSFFRQFERAKVPQEYYDYIQGTITREALFDRYRKQATRARKEAWLATLGEEDPTTVRTRIQQALGTRKNWVLIGGPPCQAYSLAGRSRMVGDKNRNFENDPRHLLYQEYLQILADHRPPVFVMENVKGLLSAKLGQKNTLLRIISDLQNPEKAVNPTSKKTLSYRLFSISHLPENGVNETRPEDFIVRSERYGIPQARHRLIIVGIRSDFRKRLPGILPEYPECSVQDVLGGLPELRSGLTGASDSQEEWIQTILSIANAGWLESVSKEIRSKVIASLKGVKPYLSRGKRFQKGNFRPGKLDEWFIDKNLKGISQHEARGHMGSDLHRYFYAAVFAEVHGRTPKINDFPEQLLPNHANIKEALQTSKFNDRFRVQIRTKPATTVVSHISKDGHYYIHYDAIQCRSLTVREAARLQTFPDNYFFEGNRTEQYHQVGNAVPPLLAHRIAVLLSNMFDNG